MNLHDILFKAYRAPLDATVTRRHYIDRHPTETMAISKGGRPAVLSDNPKSKAIYKKVTKFLLQNPGATAAEIASHLKSDTSKLGNYTQRMCDAGVLRYEFGMSPSTGGRRKFCYYVTEAV